MICSFRKLALALDARLLDGTSSTSERVPDEGQGHLLQRRECRGRRAVRLTRAWAASRPTPALGTPRLSPPRPRAPTLARSHRTRRARVSCWETGSGWERDGPPGGFSPSRGMSAGREIDAAQLPFRCAEGWRCRRFAEGAHPRLARWGGERRIIKESRGLAASSPRRLPQAHRTTSGHPRPRGQCARAHRATFASPPPSGTARRARRCRGGSHRPPAATWAASCRALRRAGCQW